MIEISKMSEEMIDYEDALRAYEKIKRQNESKLRYQKEHPEKYREYSRNYYQKNKERINKKRREDRKKD